MNEIHFDILKNPNSPQFFHELSMVPNYLKDTQFKEFLKIMNEYFEQKQNISPKIGRSLLVTLRKILKTEKFRNKFLTSEYKYRLPFENKKYSLYLLNICYDFAVSAPEAFNESLCQQFSTIVPYFSQKCLVVIALYSQHFDDDNIDPWPMVDLLFRQTAFSSPTNAVEFSKLLTYLCSNYPPYLLYRSNHCWIRLCDLLNMTETYSLTSIYSALITIISLLQADYGETFQESPHSSPTPQKSSKITKSNKKSHQNSPPSPKLVQNPLDNIFPPPLKFLIAHIENPELQELVLSLLIKCPFKSWFTTLSDPTLINALLKAAETNEHASLFLTKLSSHSLVGEILLQDTTWLEKSLPTPIDTLRLSLAIFQHQKLREIIADAPEFPNLLLAFTLRKNPGMLTIVCTLLRRIQITSERVRRMISPNSQFLKVFFDTARDLGDPVSLNSALLVARNFGKCEYASEFIELCPTIANCVHTDDGPLKKLASVTAADLSIHKKVAEKLNSLGFRNYFSKLLDSSEYESIAQRFLKYSERVQHN